MKTLRSHEGYLYLDHGAGPGLTDEDLRFMGKSAHPAMKRGVFESATYTCSHCERVTVGDPKRQRERSYCYKCDDYLCDGCGARFKATGICKPYKELVYEAQIQADKGILVPNSPEDAVKAAQQMRR